jgi:hypothetical protein
MSFEPSKQYLGDGVYLTVNAHEIILTTENGIIATNTVVMEHRDLIKLVELYNYAIRHTKAKRLALRDPSDTEGT